MRSTTRQSADRVERAGALALWWSMAVMVTGCEAAADLFEEGGAPAAGPVEVPLEFGACPDDLPGPPTGRDCARAMTPLFWGEPQGEQLELMVVRYRAATASRGQLWLLDGGPGGTGAAFMDANLIERYQGLGLDLYIPQHRGTGHSTPLRCDDPTDIGGCGQQLIATWGERLRAFHSVEAGHDLGFLIAGAKQPSEPVFVLGASYGTYWAQRYLQAFPAQADGVILEGVLPIGQAMWNKDVPADEAARSLFEACRRAPGCAAVFGGRDPEAVAATLLERSSTPEARCLGASGPDRDTLVQWLTGLVMNEAAQAVPGLLRRLERCSARDQAELLAFAENAGASASAPPENVFSLALSGHVLRTDLMASLEMLPLDELLSARQPLMFWSGTAPVEALAAYVATWPVSYPPAPTEFGDLDTPVLLRAGGLDVATPPAWAKELAPRVGGQLVQVPFTGHVVDFALNSPFTTADAACVLSMQGAFFDRPGVPVDTSCVTAAHDLDVSGQQASSAALAAYLYGGETPLLGAE